jgi:4-hydroxyphenylpyruvate dioxygenase
MHDDFISSHHIDYIEIYSPLAKILAYWHEQALGFKVTACADIDTGMPGIASYVCKSQDICLVLTSSYPISNSIADNDISSFIEQHYCGVKRLAIRVSSAKIAFENAIENGAFPTKYPYTLKDENGYIEEAGIKLFDDVEILFINRENYTGLFKPGYKPIRQRTNAPVLFSSVDHIASEVRINESKYWTNYLSDILGTRLIQSIQKCEENKTGMILRINQSHDKHLTLVIAEPETYMHRSKVQKNIEIFGPGIHHLAFLTGNMIETIQQLSDRGVEFIKFPDSYYELLRMNNEFNNVDIDSLQKNGIIIDKENDTYILQKFIKPITDRPFFFYEIVERVNGYNGFALNNINVLKKAEELEIIKQ